MWKFLFRQIARFNPFPDLSKSVQGFSHLSECSLDGHAALRSNTVGCDELRRGMFSIFIERGMTEIEFGLRRFTGSFGLFKKFMRDAQEAIARDAEVLSNF